MNNRADQLLIERLKVDCVIGIHDWEKKIKQQLVIDLEIENNIAQAAKSDEIANTVNYFDVCQSVTNFLEKTKHGLIETVAQNIANLLFSEFAATAVTIKVAKPCAIESASSVAIKIHRVKPSS